MKQYILVYRDRNSFFVGFRLSCEVVQNFPEQFWSIEKIENLGLQQVPNVDGTYIQTWVDLVIHANSKYPNFCKANGWPRFPLEI